MKVQINSIGYQEYYPIYAKIPNENKFKGLEQIGLNKAMFAKRKYLTIEEFERLKAFYESVKRQNECLFSETGLGA